MAAPHIGYVIKRFPRLSETFVLRELLELERLGLHVTVLALGRTDEPVVHADYGRLKAPVIYADELPEPPSGGAASGSREARFARRFAPAVRELGLTHLHAHFATSAADVARWIGHASGVPFSFTAHAKDIFHESVSADALDALVGAAAFVVTVSDYNVEFLRRACPSAAQTPIHRIYNGIEPGRLRPTADARDAERILAVGRLVEKKGFDIFVDAIGRLRAERPGVRATLIGTGRCEADLKARIDARGLRDVITMPGAQTQDEVVAAMRRHTLLAVPCVVSGDGDRDGLPTVIIEAMALGLPVVATPVTGIPEIVQPGRTGVIVPQRDPAALATAMQALLDDAALRERLAAAGRALVEHEFDSTRNAVTLAALFTRASAGTLSMRPTDAMELAR